MMRTLTTTEIKSLLRRGASITFTECGLTLNAGSVNAPDRVLDIIENMGLDLGYCHLQWEGENVFCTDLRAGETSTLPIRIH